jgi:mono/diheme cytochrome c family protein
MRKLVSVRASLCLALILVASLGCMRKTDPFFQQGQHIYKTYCLVCHGPNGGGVLYRETVLNNSAFVIGNPDAVIAVILYGKEGEGTMPSWHGKLTDQEVAAVATYIRQAWSNQADPVTVSMVTKIRTRAETSSIQK